MKPTVLLPEERAFLELVARAAFANPFGPDREGADLALSGLGAGASAQARLRAALGKVRGFFTKMEHRGRGDIKRYTAADRGLLETGHLFEVFHQFRDSFDELIRTQIAKDAEACPVPFASEVLDELGRRGFARAVALRGLALFYQLRRAYYFIDCRLIGCSPCMRQLRRGLWNQVFTADMRVYERFLWNRMDDFSTLLLGETGTGKGAAATAIGRSGFIPFDEKRAVFSESFMSSFTAINLSQFPESLIESELFGHRKGAFTGATESHMGVFARCSPCGSIFLDEIGDVSVPVQIKLLKVLQDRIFSPVGGHEKLVFRGRVIAASNRSLMEQRRKGLFRDDFFYRLCTDVIVLPPLRQRIAEDPRELDELLALTVRRILGEVDEGAPSRGASPATLSIDVVEITESIRGVIERDVGPAYGWPGNVRELEQCVRRILLTGQYEGASPAAGGSLRAELGRGIDAGSWKARDLVAGYCRLLYERHGTYEEVARRTGLDRRTVKKHVESAKACCVRGGVQAGGME